MELIVLFALSALGVTIGDIFLANWAESQITYYLILGLVFNVIGIFFYAQTLRTQGLGVATAIFLSVNIIAVLLAGSVFFDEHITLTRVLGIVTIIGGIVLIEI